MSDHLIQLLKTAAEQASENYTDRIQITLTAGGVLITGEVISAKDFMLSDPLTDAFSEIARSVGGAEASFEESLDDGFIHLTNAFFIQGGNTIPANSDGISLRIRIESIAAYSFSGLTKY